jgi:tight adherence protein C
VGILPLVIAVLLGGAVIMVFVGLAIPRSSDQVQARLAEYGTRTRTLEEIELEQPFSERVIQPIFRGIAGLLTRLTPGQSAEATERNLEKAGRPFGWSSTEFLGARGVCAILFAILPFLILGLMGIPWIQRLLFTALGAGLGFFLPLLWLRQRISSRQNNVRKSLPDALDLLTICVEAGLGFDAALSRVVEKWDNDLSIEFARVITEMRMGKLRREALRDMADRVDVSDITAFVAAIIQADQLGVSIAKVLRVQSDQMRLRRRQRAEEEAHRATIKILFPLAFLIFPSLFIVLLGPAVPNLIAVFGNL